MGHIFLALFVCFSIPYYSLPSEPSAKKQHYDTEKTKVLREAVSLYSLADMPRLIEANADPEAQTILGETVLHAAAFGNDTELCRLALKHNLDPNAEDHLRVTPAMKASSISVLRLLIERGANIHKKSRSGRTALHHHAVFSSPVRTGDTISLLCDEGSDPNTQDDEGDTALHTISTLQDNINQEKLAALCIQGADITLKNKHEQTPREKLQKKVELRLLAPGDIAAFDAIVAAATEVRALQQAARNRLIAAHLPPQLTPLVNDYIGGLPWNEQCKSEVNMRLKQRKN